MFTRAVRGTIVVVRLTWVRFHRCVQLRMRFYRTWRTRRSRYRAAPMRTTARSWPMMETCTRTATSSRCMRWTRGGPSTSSVRLSSTRSTLPTPPNLTVYSRLLCVYNICVSPSSLKEIPRDGSSHLVDGLVNCKKTKKTTVTDLWPSSLKYGDVCGLCRAS